MSSISLPGIGSFDLSTVGNDALALNQGVFQAIGGDISTIGGGIGSSFKSVLGGTIGGLGGTKFLLIAGGCIVIFILLK